MKKFSRVMKTNPNKELVVYFFSESNPDSWSRQMSLMKRLTSKYTEEEIKYATDYYRRKGAKLTSVGFLLYRDNMLNPCTELHALKNISSQTDSSTERNIHKANNKKQKKESYYNMFE